MFLLQCPCFVEIVQRTIPLALAACTQTLQLFEMISSLLRVWQFGKSRLLSHARPSPCGPEHQVQRQSSQGHGSNTWEGRTAVVQRGRGVCSGEVSKFWFPLKRGKVPGRRWVQPSAPSSVCHLAGVTWLLSLPAPGKVKHYPRRKGGWCKNKWPNLLFRNLVG